LRGILFFLGGFVSSFAQGAVAFNPDQLGGIAFWRLAERSVAFRCFSRDVGMSQPVSLPRWPATICFLLPRLKA